MALDRFYRLPPERQRQLLATAASAFAEGGYDGTSFNKLLERLGFSKSQAYYYFSDKADLYATACASCYEQFYERAAELPLPEGRDAFWAYVLELNRVGFCFYNDNPMAARLARATAGSAQLDELARAGVRLAGSTQERYLGWLRLGQQLGAVRSDLPEPFLVSLCVQSAACADVWFAERAGRASAEEIERLSLAMTDLSWRMLHPHGAPALTLDTPASDAVKNSRERVASKARSAASSRGPSNKRKKGNR
jgi:AcrR family transcriptional regulator